MKKETISLICFLISLTVFPIQIINAQRTVNAGASLSVAFSPNGKYLAVGYATNGAILIDVATQTAIKSFKHDDWVYSVAFSNDGKILITCDGKSIIFWDITTATKINEIPNGEHVYTLSLSTDGKIIASAGYKDIKLWNISTGELIKSFVGFDSWVYSVSISPDSKLLAGVGADLSVKIWDVSTGNLIKELAGHTHSIRSVKFSNDGSKLYSGSEDDFVKIWDVNTWTELSSYFASDYMVNSLVLSEDNLKMITGGGDKKVRVWDLTNNKPIAIFEGNRDAVYSVAISPDGKIIASAGADKSVRLWDVQSKKKLPSILNELEPYEKDTSTYLDNRDGNIYKTVKIGTQWWMAENLKYQPSSGNYWAYNNNNSYVSTYGYLYDWETACNVCPDGWHLSSLKDWNVLAEQLGDVTGIKMKETGNTHWNESKVRVTNSSGFTALPGGMRSYYGSFERLGKEANFWTSLDLKVPNSWGESFLYNYDVSIIKITGTASGFSVRCVKD